MADIIDNANNHAELFLQSALSKRMQISLKPCGRCHYCNEVVSAAHLYCDSECAKDHEEELRRKKIAGQ